MRYTTMCKNCNYIHNLGTQYLKGLPPAFKKAMQDLYDGKISPDDLAPELVELLAQELWEGVKFGTEGEKLATGGLIKSMNDNIYVFSGFKTYQQLKEASLLLRDNEGVTKAFTTFLKDVQAINETYNINYLKAEYNHAVAQSQMAGNWLLIQERKAVAPYLKYKTAEDERVRESHRPLNNVIKLVDDPFWDTFYPPNGWGCRCDVIQIIDGTITTEFDAPEIPPMFAVNAGKTGVIFPDTHPYFSVPQDVSDKIKTKAILIKNQVAK